MAARLAVGFHGDPVRMSVVNVLVYGMRIHARDHIHAQLAAARQHFAERVAIAKELAAVMQRYLGGIKRHASAGAKACRVGVNSLEIVEPEGRVVASRVVLDEGQLRPSHGPVEPACCRLLLRESRAGRRHRTGLEHPLASIDFRHKLRSWSLLKMKARV